MNIDKNISILDFMNSNTDWADLLQNEFYVKPREDGEYILLKYNQFETDMSYRLAQECRGSIFRKDEETGKYIYVCRPFDKFFNYGEQFAADIDWNTARVTEKVDGSLCKLWFDKGEWHLSTNGTIDAFKAPVGENELSFGEVFVRAAGIDIQTLGSTLYPEYTYMFELTSPETQVVISYKDAVYYLTLRETKTGKEIFEKPMFSDAAKIKYPKVYQINKLEDVIAAANMMSKDEEGFVVNDNNGNRIKVKSPEYLIAAHLQMNGNVTDKRILKMLRNDQLDDFLAYAPNCKENVDRILDAIHRFSEAANEEWERVNSIQYDSQKDFAFAVKDSSFRPYLFLKQLGSDITPMDWLLKTAVSKALKMLNPYFSE